MKRTIELDDFIDALVKAKSILALSDQWESKLASYQTQEETLRRSLDDLVKKEQDLKASVGKTSASVAATIQQYQNDLEAQLVARRAEQDRTMQEIAQMVAKAQQDAKTFIGKAKADELAAQAAASQAQKQLDELRGLLSKAKDDAKKMAAMVS